MRITIVTETYFPQVNGVSRTLGELVRHLTDAATPSSWSTRIMASPSRRARSTAHAVRSVVLPFYKELFLPLPPFGAVHRAIDAFRPDLVHIATEATLGLSVLRFALRRRLNVVSSFHTNFDQYSRPLSASAGPRGLIGRYLRWFHNRTRETYVPSRATIARARTPGVRAAGALAAGRGRRRLFRPDRPGRPEVRRALGWSPEDLVIGYVSRIAAGEERGLPGRRPGDRGRAPARRPDPHGRRRPVPGRPGAPARAGGPVRRLPKRATTSPTITPRPTSSPSRA